MIGEVGWVVDNLWDGWVLGRLVFGVYSFVVPLVNTGSRTKI